MKTSFQKIAWCAAALSMVWIGCGSPEPAPIEAPPPLDMTALTAEIQAMEDAYAAGEIKKDADAVVAYYAQDIVSYSKEEEPTVGKEAMLQRLADRMAKDSLGYTPTFKVLEIFPGEDHITEIGSWSMADTSGAVKDKGTYFSVFRKEGDKWLCIRDISVSSMKKELQKAEASAQ